MKETVEQFITHYQREYDYYSQVAKICANQSESKLESSGIRAIVTFRAKRADKLYDKLIKRDIEKKYQTIDDIYNDIVDLAGVRIAMYFPGDMPEIDKLIHNKFNVQRIKEFPEIGKVRNGKTFIGYKAKHYRVNLKEETLIGSEKRFSNALIEIQIASVLMHGWAEVEHDLVYKPLNGGLSEDELAILDELNGLVLTGEIALERLQRAYKRRIENEDKQFNNHFELASYIYDVIKIDNPKINPDNSIGKVDVLFMFIQAINFNKPDKIKKYISKLVFSDDERPISEQIIDSILMEHPKLYDTFEKVKIQFISKKHYKTQFEELSNEESFQTLIGSFISKWILLETTLTKEIKKIETSNLNEGTLRRTRPFSYNLILVKEHNLLNEQEYRQFEYLRRFRNNLIHGIEMPDESSFSTAIDMIESLVSKFVKQPRQKKK
jgi:ppGpp synthetase/RelA/SpoT-type nucleotidyltranferase